MGVDQNIHEIADSNEGAPVTMEAVSSIVPELEDKVKTDLDLLFRYEDILEHQATKNTSDLDMFTNTQCRIASYGHDALPFIREAFQERVEASGDSNRRYQLMSLYRQFLSALAEKEDVPELTARIDRINEGKEDGFTSLSMLYDTLYEVTVDIQNSNPEDPLLGGIDHWVRNNLYGPNAGPLDRFDLMKILAATRLPNSGQVCEEHAGTLQEQSYDKAELLEILSGDIPSPKRHLFLTASQIREDRRRQKEEDTAARIEQESAVREKAGIVYSAEMAYAPATGSDDAVETENNNYGGDLRVEKKPKKSWWKATPEKTTPSYEEIANALQSEEFFIPAMSRLIIKTDRVKAGRDVFHNDATLTQCIGLVATHLSKLKKIIAEGREESEDQLSIGTALYALTQMIEDGTGDQRKAAFSAVLPILGEHAPQKFQNDLVFELNRLAGNKDRPELQKDVNILISQNFDVFLGIVDKVPFTHNFENLSANERAYLSLSFLCGACNRRYIVHGNKEKLVTFLSQDPDKVARIIREIGVKKEENKKIFEEFFGFIDRENVFGYPKLVEIARKVCSIATPQDNYIDTLLKTNIGEFGDGVREYATEALIGYGYDPDTAKAINSSWVKGSAKTYSTEEDQIKYQDALVLNLHVMREMEGRRKGCCKSLTDEFGIVNFARYGLEILITQYDRKDSDLPYIVIANPLADWNGAFYSSRSSIESLNEEITKYNEEHNTAYIVRIVEGNKDRLHFNKNLIKLHRKYSRKNLISELIVGGHGDVVGKLAFNSNLEDKSYLETKHLKHPATPGVARLFEEDAVVVFDSCYQGVTSNLAQETSKRLNCITTGPSDAALVASMEIVQIKGKMRIFPKYENKQGLDVTKIYYKGQEVDLDFIKNL